MSELIKDRASPPWGWDPALVLPSEIKLRETAGLHM